MAAAIPTLDTIHIQINNGRDTVRKILFMIVLSWGTLPPGTKRVDEYWFWFVFLLKITVPDFHIKPGQVVSLSIVETQLFVATVNDLFDLGQRNTVTLWTEGYETLKWG